MSAWKKTLNFISPLQNSKTILGFHLSIKMVNKIPMSLKKTWTSSTNQIKTENKLKEKTRNRELILQKMMKVPNSK